MIRNLLPLRFVEGASLGSSRVCPGPPRPLRRCFARAPWCARPTASASARPSAPEPAGGGPFRGPSSGPRVSAAVSPSGVPGLAPQPWSPPPGPGGAAPALACPHGPALLLSGAGFFTLSTSASCSVEQKSNLMTKQTNQQQQNPPPIGVRKREEVCKLGPGLFLRTSS